MDPGVVDPGVVDPGVLDPGVVDPGVLGSWGPGVLELEETSNLWEHQASTQTGASV